MLTVKVIKVDIIKKHCNSYTLIAAIIFFCLIISEVLFSEGNSLLFITLYLVFVVSLGGIVFIPQKEYAIFSSSGVDITDSHSPSMVDIK